MTKFARLLIVLLIFPLQACTTYKIRPFELGITLPYSENCRFKNVITKEIYEMPPPDCERIKKRSLILTPESWRVIRTDILTNCAKQQCKQFVGYFDELFLAVDEGMQIIPY